MALRTKTQTTYFFECDMCSLRTKPVIDLETARKEAAQIGQFFDESDGWYCQSCADADMYLLGRLIQVFCPQCGRKTETHAKDMICGACGQNLTESDRLRWYELDPEYWQAKKAAWIKGEPIKA